MEHNLGWRIKPGGTQTDIERCFTLFVNHDHEPGRAEAALNWLHPGMAFIHMTLVRLEAALARHFYLMVLFSQEVPITGWTRRGFPRRDEVKAARLAKAYAARFITDHVKIEAFMPRSESLSQTHYALTLPQHESSDGLEALVGAALGRHSIRP